MAVCTESTNILWRVVLVVAITMMSLQLTRVLSHKSTTFTLLCQQQPVANFAIPARCVLDFVHTTLDALSEILTFSAAEIRQTRKVESLVVERPWWFKSTWPHHFR